jgi:hypothetical protein
MHRALTHSSVWSDIDTVTGKTHSYLFFKIASHLLLSVFNFMDFLVKILYRSQGIICQSGADFLSILCNLEDLVSCILPLTDLVLKFAF